MTNTHRITDIFIKRPVLATSISLLIILLGFAGIMKMSLRQYPKMDNTTIVVTTAYPGASAKVVQGFITTPLSQSVGSADGIDYLESTSKQGVSTVTAHIKLNFDPNAALTEITGKVNAVLAQLPAASKSPIIIKQTGDTMPGLILGFTSKTMTPEQVTAYITNVIEPKLHNVGGISQIRVWGEKKYAMRIWLNPKRMAELSVTPNQVTTALTNNNVQATPGRLKPTSMYINIATTTDLHTVAEFNNLVIKNDSGRLIRIKDIGHAQLGLEDYDTQVYYNGKKAVFAALNTAPGANPLTVVGGVLKEMPNIEKSFPPGLHAGVVYNSTTFIRISIDEVIKTIFEATAVVMLVIFLFLGAFRSVSIPVITIPLSLIGVCFLMLIMGFSLNLLTLLAMVLAIGLVVDDAIVVLENIYRHIELGATPYDAAIKGAREIANPVILMTLTLAAVFAPIGFLGGLTGALFTEFAFTLAATVIISGIVALTLSPMLCSKILDPSICEVKLVKRVDAVLNNLRDRYHRRLTKVLDYRLAVLVVAATVLVSCFFLFTGTKSELAPTEDQGFIGVIASAPNTANLNYMEKYSNAVGKAFSTFPQNKNTLTVDGVFPTSTSIFGGSVLKDWSSRSKTAMELAPLMQKKLAQIPGLNSYVFLPPSLPGISFGPGVQFVVTSTSDHKHIYPAMEALVKAAQKSGLFVFVSSTLKFDSPQLNVHINRAKAADLGISMSDIAGALNTMTGDNLVNYFSKLGYSYEVIPQMSDQNRRMAKQLDSIYVSTTSGKLVPLSTVVDYSYSVTPASLYQFQQLNAATLNAVMMPGISEGQALAFLQKTADHLLPTGMSYNYSGSLRQFVEEGDAMVYAFIFAILVIFLLLSMQFESFRDPIIILVSVPMSICGALIPLYLGAATINIYTQIGLITLVGLISKHGILMVEFANKLQETEGLSVRKAIEKASAIRLRPILMTTFAMVFGVFPLIFSHGAGSVSRHNVGLVIAFGMAIGTCFTLFVVPTMYTYLAKDRKKETNR
jgi:multidrug efflux pump